MDIFVDPHFDTVYRRHPLVLVDAGARGGLKKNWFAAKSHLRIIGFEPEIAEYGRLAVKRTDVPTGTDTMFNVALSNRTGQLRLNVAREPGLTSIFEPNLAFLDAFPESKRFDTVDQHDVIADTLDNVLQAHLIDDVDFVKADTQGSELFILEGGSNTLTTSTVGVEVELEFSPIYKNQPLFSDVDTFLRSLGFLLFDLRPCYWKRAVGRGVGGPYGQIIWADALYLKTTTALRSMIAVLDADRQQGKVLKALSVALLYGYVDYALEILHEVGDQLSADERALIERRLRESDRRHNSLPNFPGRRHFAAVFRRLWKLFREPSDSWSISDPGIGNLD